MGLLREVRHSADIVKEEISEKENRLPLVKKMKVLKKFKRRMGLAPRSSGSQGSASPNNLPAILFNQIHGDNIRLSRDGAVARRVESFCKGVTFTNRPIKVGERVYIKFIEISNSWSGVIRFGFTANDPSHLRNSLPKYACPDLTNKPGYWAKALAERFAERNSVLFYYVTQSGDVHFGINGEEKGIFFSGVDTRGPLWALVDVYGNSTAIELVDPRQHLNNARTSPSDHEVERWITPALSGLNISSIPAQSEPSRGDDDIPAIRHHQGVHFMPLPLHRIRGRHVRMSADRTVAWRTESEFCHGYVFSSRPVNFGEKIVIQVCGTENVFVGALAFGLTACDPATIQASQLPDDSDLLLDRPEYWVVSKDVANSPQRGDELSFTITTSGEVQFSKNGSQPSVFMHIDNTLTLWAFFDVYGNTQKIRVLGSTTDFGPVSGSASPLNVNSLNEARMRVNLNQTSPPLPTRVTSTSPSGLVVSLPPSRVVSPPNHSPGRTVVSPPPGHSPARMAQSPLTVQLPVTTSGTMLSTTSSTYMEPVSMSSYNTMDSSWEAMGNECTICYEQRIDSVLYTCGHMCMCYNCAIQQWKGRGGGQCPLCRAVIYDVIRTYRS